MRKRRFGSKGEADAEEGGKGRRNAEEEEELDEDETLKPSAGSGAGLGAGFRAASTHANPFVFGRCPRACQDGEVRKQTHVLPAPHNLLTPLDPARVFSSPPLPSKPACIEGNCHHPNLLPALLGCPKPKPQGIEKAPEIKTQSPPALTPSPSPAAALRASKTPSLRRSPRPARSRGPDPSSPTWPAGSLPSPAGTFSPSPAPLCPPPAPGTAFSRRWVSDR